MIRSRWTIVALLGVVAAGLSGLPSRTAVPDYNLLVVRIEQLVDTNGDLDGQLDTNETGELTLAVTNQSASAARNFDLRFRAAGGRIDSLSPAVIHIASLAPGATVVLAPIELHVAAEADRGGPSVTCRNPGPLGICSNLVVVPGGCATNAACQVGALDDFSETIGIEVLGASAPAAPWGFVLGIADPYLAVPDRLVLDLDLDSSYAAGPTTTFAEEFDSGGFGAFTFANLDAQIASNSASDGARCQYANPDYPTSNSYGETECYLGFAGGQSPINDWHNHFTTSPDGGRAFTGARSLHYGKHVNSSPGIVDSMGLSQMDAVRTKNPIPLAARICASDPSANPRACATDSDCVPVGGGACVPSRPVLSFKHQVSLVDGRCVAASLGTVVDRAVVAAQPDGTATWLKLAPYHNLYDAQASDFFTNCTFDPTDDGNNEESFFDPADPARRLGPSSTCFPEFSFDNVGDTYSPFLASRVNRASDGPGLPGSLGPGTWVESRFDLSRFRGRSIRIRFLVTTIKVSDITSYETVFMWNPTPCDDGWWIDDVQVSLSLGSTAPTVGADGADNGSLPGAVDADGDGRPDAFDCAPAEPGAFAVPPEVFELRAASGGVISWESATPFAGSQTVYDLLRGDLGQWPVGAGAGETCVANRILATSFADAQMPGMGVGYWYLVRARNVCGDGPYGYDSTGAARQSTACP